MRFSMAYDAAHTQRRHARLRGALDDVMENLSEEDAAELLDRIDELLGDYQPAEDRGGIHQPAYRAVGRDRHRHGRDEPPPFPGRPRPGGEMDPMLRRDQLDAEDRGRRRHAEDAAAALPFGQHFDDLFPAGRGQRAAPGDPFFQPIVRGY